MVLTKIGVHVEHQLIETNSTEMELGASYNFGPNAKTNGVRMTKKMLIAVTSEMTLVGLRPDSLVQNATGR